MALGKSQIINDLIRKRKTFATKPKQLKEQLKSLEVLLLELETQKQIILEKPGIPSNFIKRLEQIDFSVLIEKAIQEQQVSENLCKRLERDSINIGVVGLARQGKSTFLQAVSGLTDNKIPSSGGQLPKVDVQQIALVDMPGFGDTTLGGTEHMIAALSQDIDFILFIRRPNTDEAGDFWKSEDINLYDIASQALEAKLSLEKWSFMLLNYDGENRRQCKDFENTIEQKGIRVTKCLTANCKNPIEANKVLEQVLQYLVENIASLDREYIYAVQSSIKSFQFEVEQELTRANEIIQVSPIGR